MKKLLIICASFTALSLSSCGGSNNTDPSPTDSAFVDSVLVDSTSVPINDSTPSVDSITTTYTVTPN